MHMCERVCERENRKASVFFVCKRTRECVRVCVVRGDNEKLPEGDFEEDVEMDGNAQPTKEGNKMLRKSIFFECTFCLKQKPAPPLPSNFFDKLPFIFIPLILILLSWLFFRTSADSHSPSLSHTRSMLFLCVSLCLSHTHTPTHTNTQARSFSLDISILA